MIIYAVMEVSKNSSCCDEWTLLRTLNKDKAISKAKKESNTLKKERFSKTRIELRVHEIPEVQNINEFDNYNSVFYDEKAERAFYDGGYNLVYFDFAEKLNAYRKDKDLTVPAFAHLLNVSLRTLENWLYGKNEPNDFVKNAVMSKLGY